jgi:hypothetical protein
MAEALAPLRMFQRTVMTMVGAAISFVTYAQEPFYNTYSNVKALWNGQVRIHAENKASDSYTYKDFIYWAHTDRPELNEAFAAELQRHLPSGTKLRVVTGEQDFEQLYKSNPGSHAFMIDVKDTELGSGSTYTISKSIWFGMYDQSGPCNSLSLETLMCHPPDVIAAIAVRNLLWRHQYAGAFMDKPHDEYFEDSKADYLAGVAALKNTTLYIADAHLNVAPDDIAKVYKGKVEVVSVQALYEMIRKGVDANVCIAMADDCTSALKGEALTNERAVMNCKTGACYFYRGGIPGSGVNKYGFYAGDFAYFTKPK